MSNELSCESELCVSGLGTVRRIIFGLIEKVFPAIDVVGKRINPEMDSSESHTAS